MERCASSIAGERLPCSSDRTSDPPFMPWVKWNQSIHAPGPLKNAAPQANAMRDPMAAATIPIANLRVPRATQ